MKFKVGDKVIEIKHPDNIGIIRDTGIGPDDEPIYWLEFERGWCWVFESEIQLYSETTKKTDTKGQLSDGGPSSYYDWPAHWNTLNDFIEDKSVNQWKGYSFHLGNIVKAVTRWGDKEGTTEEYDAKKIIYSGCRVLKMIAGKEKLRTYLQSLLDDPQFK